LEINLSMNNSFTLNEYYDESFTNLQLETEDVISARFTDCKFINCKFPNILLKNSRFNNCEFIECDLNLVIIKSSSFPGTSFKKSKLMGINWTTSDWSNTSFGKLKGFTDCVISLSTFINLDLKGIKIKDCIAHEVDFRNADMSEAELCGTDLLKSIFIKTNLTKADLSKAKNYDINPGLNTLSQAKFSLPEAMSLLYNMDIKLIE
jgi:fluoroquinolone resistance protein